VVLAWARARQAGEVGAAAPPTDVDTTGSSPEHDPQAATTAPDDWRQNPYVQLEGGFLAGVSLGLVPMGGVGQQLADAGEVLPHGTPEARLGLAVGQIVGGIALTVGGFTGEVLGGAATVTGIGVAVGVPAMVVSTTLVVGGAGNIAAGIRGLMTTGSGSTGPQGTAPAAGGVRTAQQIAGKISGNLKCFGRCADFANALQRELQKAGVSGTRIEIQVGKWITPYSNKFGALAERGRNHTAIRVGDTVFDNFRPGGVSYSDFIADLGGSDFFGTPFVRVLEAAF